MRDGCLIGMTNPGEDQHNLEDGARGRLGFLRIGMKRATVGNAVTTAATTPTVGQWIFHP